jgi:hypothetical protein
VLAYLEQAFSREVVVVDGYAGVSRRLASYTSAGRALRQRVEVVAQVFGVDGADNRRVHVRVADREAEDELHARH